jgi:hypothetical protein
VLEVSATSKNSFILGRWNWVRAHEINEGSVKVTAMTAAEKASKLIAAANPE